MSVPHLEMMLHYANVICVKYPKEPWKRVQLLQSGCRRWVALENHPSWQPYIEYRFLPETITINGIEVPEPIMVEPEEGTNVWSPLNIYADTTLACLTFRSGTWCKWLFQNCLLHATESAAQAHLDAICAASRQQEGV